MFHGRPDLPALRGGDLDDRRLPVQQQRRPAHGEPLPGDALGDTERHVEDGLRVFDVRRAADGEDLRLPDRRRLGVERLARLRRGDPAAQPARPGSRGHRGGVSGGDEHDDLTGPVQPAGAVGAGPAGDPAGTVPRLPDQRRLPRVDADALHPAVQAYGDDAPGHGGGQSEQQGVAGFRPGLEARDVLARAERRGAVGLIARHRRGDQPDQRARHDRQLLGGGEHHRLLGLAA